MKLAILHDQSPGKNVADPAGVEPETSLSRRTRIQLRANESSEGFKSKRKEFAPMKGFAPHRAQSLSSQSTFLLEYITPPHVLA